MLPCLANRPTPLTVLVVDDEPGFRSVVEDMLAFHGLKVIVAADGRQALEVAGREDLDLDLVLTDFRMPGLDGVETLLALGRLRPGLKRILCSGYSEQDCLRGRTLADYVYLGKPFGLAKLTAVLEAVLGGSAAPG